MLDDPLSLLGVAVWLMAAGMWPVGLGYMFGVCSACCQQECVCLPRWCCSGDIRDEITVRVATVSSTNGIMYGEVRNPDFWEGQIEFEPDCAQIDGDYVLQKGDWTTEGFGSDCEYQFTPNCDALDEACAESCPDPDDIDCELLDGVFIPGAQLRVFADNSGDGYKFNFRLAFADGGEMTLGGCNTFYGVPATVSGDFTYNGALAPLEPQGDPVGLSGLGLAGESQTLLLSGISSNVSELAESPDCDIETEPETEIEVSFGFSIGWPEITSVSPFEFFEYGSAFCDSYPAWTVGDSTDAAMDFEEFGIGQSDVLPSCRYSLTILPP